MDTYSQMLCRLVKPTLFKANKLGERSRLSACAAAFLCLCQAALAVPTVQTPATDVKTAQAPGSAEKNLLQTAKDWISQRTGIALDEIQMNTMDERLKVAPCETSTQFDQPFANRHVIRARCDQPRWQYFLQASWSQNLDHQKTNPQTASLGLNTASQNNNNGAVNNKTAQTVPMSYPYQANTNVNAFGEVVRSVLVLSQPLKKGTILNSTHFKKISISVPQNDGQILTQSTEIENFELLHDMGSEQIIHSFDVKPSVMVKRGQEVTLVFGQGRGFTISVKTEALQDGIMGEQVKLKNVESGRIISGVVTGFSEAKGL